MNRLRWALLRHVTSLWWCSRRLVLGIFGLLLVLPTAAYAATAVAQSYEASEKLAIGSIVSLQKDAATRVEAASTSNVENLFGVVINSDSAALSITTGTKNQVQVATNGMIRVLVSNANGKISRGDHVTASPVAGVGMKASSNVRIIGIAQEDMIESDTNKHTYKDASGTERSVILGDIPVLVNVSYFFKEPDKTLIPSAIQNVANALAGKEVSPLPIIISGAIFLVTMIIVASIVYSMIKNSIISVGRNPMSQAAIYRDLIHMSALVLAILAVAIGAIYLILTRLQV